MSDAAILILGICSCAVVFASHGKSWTVAALLVAAFIVFLGTRNDDE